MAKRIITISREFGSGGRFIGEEVAKNCILTPHISWAPKESRQRIMDTTVENVRAFLAGAPVNVVNR